MTAKILDSSFFNRKTTAVAKELLGKYIVRKRGDEITALMLSEVEAYEGFSDKASHAHKGITKRNAVMFGPAGYFYVYLCYGMYWMLNIVTERKDFPAAILIRGAGKLNGPGKLTKFLEIDGTINGLNASDNSSLWFEDRGIIIPNNKIRRTPRIGVHYAGEIWANKPYRFIIP